VHVSANEHAPSGAKHGQPLERSKRKRITHSVDPGAVNDTKFLQELIDTFPAMTFVVDDDVTVVAFNASAGTSLRLNASALQHLTGQVLSCVNAVEGCGRTHKCHDCEIRRAINSASEGLFVERKQTTMQLAIGGNPRDFHLLVTARPYRYGAWSKVLLFIENITEYVTLQKLVSVVEKYPQITSDPEAARLLQNYRALLQDDTDR
jgi:hypothetical protein